MKSTPGVVLKPGKDKAIRNKHHWIFSGAVQKYPSFSNGEILPVYSYEQDLLGFGYFNKSCNIVGRMISFDSTSPMQSLQRLLDAAWELRNGWFDRSKTNAFRLINGEGDGVPGLVIDVYHDVFVLQSSTKGIDQLKPWIVDYIVQKYHPRAIYEKSLIPSRKEEGLKDHQGYLYGSPVNEVTFIENGLHYKMTLEKSQKTGFFLDHREMRDWIRSLSSGKRVLNAFSYTGGFTLSALAGGADVVDSVDISQEAINAAESHVSLNGYEKIKHQFFCDDVFTFLRDRELDYNLVILDPPAFAKKQKDIIPACRGYKDINRLAMQKMPAKSLLLTCSCSHYIDENLFQKVLFQAAAEAKRDVRIVGRHRLAPDHPINIFHPESEYLKSFLLYII